MPNKKHIFRAGNDMKIISFSKIIFCSIFSQNIEEDDKVMHFRRCCALVKTKNMFLSLQTFLLPAKFNIKNKIMIINNNNLKNYPSVFKLGRRGLLGIH
jgi:hypothetical protein